MWRWAALAGAFSAGLGVRFLLRGYATPDTTEFLLPWYAFARVHGVAALSTGFTNYAPLYPACSSPRPASTAWPRRSR